MTLRADGQSSTFLEDNNVTGSGKESQPKKQLKPLTKEELQNVANLNRPQQSMPGNIDVNAKQVERSQSWWDAITPDTDQNLARANDLERDAYEKALTAKYTNSKKDIDAAKIAQNKFNSALRSFFAANPDATYRSAIDYEKKITPTSIPKDYAGYPGQTKSDSTGKVSTLQNDGTWTPYVKPTEAASYQDEVKNTAVEKSPIATASWGYDAVGQWKGKFTATSDGSYILTNGTTTAPISFTANNAGQVYLSKSNKNQVEYLDEARQRVLDEFSQDPTKLAEFQDTLISRGIVTAAEAKKINSWRSYNSGLIDTTSLNYLTMILNATTAKNLSTLATSKSANPKIIGWSDYLKYGSVQGIKDYIASSGGGNGYGGGTPSRTVSYDTRKYTTNDLEIGIDNIFQQLTGKGASEEDVKHLTDWVNSRSTTKTVTNRSGSTSKSVTSGGLTNDAIDAKTREMALNAPGAEEYNKATTYMDYFMQALNSPIQLG